MTGKLTKTILAVAAIACLGLASSAHTQEKPDKADKQEKPDKADKQDKNAGPGQDDPFYQKPKPQPVPEDRDANKPIQVPFPTLAERQQDYLNERSKARAKGLPDPDPIGQYLVNELNVTGVFETDTGVGAFVQAIPTNTTFFVGPGTKVYNGEILSITGGSNFDLGQVMFRELTKYRVKKKEQDVITTVTKTVSPPAGGGRP
jgi:hypothetical protein